MSKLTITLTAAALGLAAISTPVLASEAPTAAISYSDLDLTSPAGIAALNRRVQSTANRLCSGHLVSNGRWGPISYQRCVAIAVESAQPQVEQVVGRANGVDYARRGPITVRGR